MQNRGVVARIVATGVHWSPGIIDLRRRPAASAASPTTTVRLTL
jgi:hypothetical protein